MGIKKVSRYSFWFSSRTRKEEIMEELIQNFENLRIIFTPSILVMFILFGISKERDRPVKYVPSWNPWSGNTIAKIKEGPPWLVIFTLCGREL